VCGIEIVGQAAESPAAGCSTSEPRKVSLAKRMQTRLVAQMLAMWIDTARYDMP